MPALLCGVLVGELIATRGDPWSAAQRLLLQDVPYALWKGNHPAILGFTLLLGSMISFGLDARLIERFFRRQVSAAASRAKVLFVAWVAGLAIFFDDYVNAVVVGSVFRPITDRLRISREKLAFVVDATAAPVTSLAPISTWIAVEVGYIDEQLKALSMHNDAYSVFIETLPYRFYPILMLFFVVALIASGRDAFSMRGAELAAWRVAPDSESVVTVFDEGNAEKPGATGPRRRAPAWLGIVPWCVLIAAVAAGLANDGSLKTGANGIGSANIIRVLLWSVALAALSSIIVTLIQGRRDARATLNKLQKGFRSMVPAAVVLALAWMLSKVCADLGTARVVALAVGSKMAVGWLPTLVFLVAAATSFATGTSWGAMAVLFPIALPLAHQLAPGQWQLFLGSTAAVLSGAVWGDHCSPISDTTIMSAAASGCDPLAHVRTQLPYALVVGAVSVVVCSVPTAFGLWSAWGGLFLGVGVLAVIVRCFRTLPTFERRDDDFSGRPL